MIRRCVRGGKISELDTISETAARRAVLDFLRWMAREHGAGLCSPGYGGEMLPLGPDREFVDQFLEHGQQYGISRV